MGLFGKILGAAKQTGKNVANNINFAAERGEYRKAPEGYKLAGTFKNGTEARETAHRYQISGYRVKLESAKDGYDRPITALYVRSGNEKGTKPVQKKSVSVVKAEKHGKVRNFTKNLLSDTAAAAKTAGNKLTGDNALRRWAENTVKDNNDFGEKRALKKKPAVKRKKAVVKVTRQKTYSGKRYELAGMYKSVFAAQTATARLRDHKCTVRVARFSLSNGTEGFAVYARKPAVRATKRKPRRSGWYSG